MYSNPKQKPTPKQNEKKKFDKIINDIEVELDSATRVPILGNVVKVSKINKKISELRKGIDEALAESRQILKHRENILKEAYYEAEEIVKKRQLELSKQSVIKQAEQIAKTIVLGAKKEADKMVKEAKEFEEQVKKRSLKYSEMIYKEMLEQLNTKIMEINEDRKKLIQMTAVEKANAAMESTRQDVERDGVKEMQAVK